MIKAIEAAFNGHKSMKHVVIVEEDVDIYNPNAVEWAIATRFQGDKDLIMKKDQPGSSLDPSGKHEPGKKTLTTKIGFDATIPSHVENSKYEIVKYNKVDLDDYLR
jgi:UbiD family decarboxylase